MTLQSNFPYLSLHPPPCHTHRGDFPVGYWQSMLEKSLWKHSSHGKSLDLSAEIINFTVYSFFCCLLAIKLQKARLQ